MNAGIAGQIATLVLLRSLSKGEKKIDMWKSYTTSKLWFWNAVSEAFSTLMKHENLHLEMKQGYFASYCQMKLMLSKKCAYK